MSASHDGWTQHVGDRARPAARVREPPSPPSAPAGGILYYANLSPPSTPSHLGATPGYRRDGSPENPPFRKYNTVHHLGPTKPQQMHAKSCARCS